MSSRDRHNAAASSAAQSEAPRSLAARVASAKPPRGAKVLRQERLKPLVAGTVARARHETGLSQAALAALVQMTPSLVAHHELAHERDCVTLVHALYYAQHEATRPIALALAQLLCAAVEHEPVPMPAARTLSPISRLHGLTCELTDVLRVVSESESDGALSVAELRERLRESRQAVDALLEVIAHDEAELARLEGRDGR